MTLSSYVLFLCSANFFILVCFICTTFWALLVPTTLVVSLGFSWITHVSSLNSYSRKVYIDHNKRCCTYFDGIELNWKFMSTNYQARLLQYCLRLICMQWKLKVICLECIKCIFKTTTTNWPYYYINFRWTRRTETCRWTKARFVLLPA